ncbi:hypothetical protein CC78DRAFT_529067 [Lojkania enalia]|uniref:Uncharacterized protein n=1 Tax=Lojkania enalia TaxID=147567 RepID=A0A9P4TQT1_9PLEO|nr:hypothetical protein CC78DRAFT_529067 [Didymosphaeria enalia]
MATPQPPLTPEQRLALEEKARYDRLTRNLAIGGVIICPIVALVPPRKLDLYTFSLAMGFYLSADHLSSHYTGKSLIHQIPLPSAPGSALPTEKAREMQRQIKEKEAMEKGSETLKDREKNKTLWHKIWMGDEKEGWKERRLEEERKALAEGKSYQSLILDQIWEVWNWDKKKNGDGKGKSDQEKKD